MFSNKITYLYYILKRQLIGVVLFILNIALQFQVVQFLLEIIIHLFYNLLKKTLIFEQSVHQDNEIILDEHMFFMFGGDIIAQ